MIHQIPSMRQAAIDSLKSLILSATIAESMPPISDLKTWLNSMMFVAGDYEAAARVNCDLYAEIDKQATRIRELEKLSRALAERVQAQSELLAKRAERSLN